MDRRAPVRSEDDGIEKSPDETSTGEMVNRLITTPTARDNGSSRALPSEAIYQMGGLGVLVRSL